jgi:hypothetical protein
MIIPEQDLMVDGDAIVLRPLTPEDKAAVTDVIQALAQQQPQLAYMAAILVLQLDAILGSTTDGLISIGVFENGTLTTVLLVRFPGSPDSQGDQAGVVYHWERPGVKALANGFSRNATLLRDFLYSAMANLGVALYWQQSPISTTAAQTTEADWSTNDQLQANATWKQVYTETVNAGNLPVDPWIKTAYLTRPIAVPVTIRKMKPAQ